MTSKPKHLLDDLGTLLTLLVLFGVGLAIAGLQP